MRWPLSRFIAGRFFRHGGAIVMRSATWLSGWPSLILTVAASTVFAILHWVAHLAFPYAGIVALVAALLFVWIGSFLLHEEQRKEFKRELAQAKVRSPSAIGVQVGEGASVREHAITGLTQYVGN